MTDNEIIKALECLCGEPNPCKDCACDPREYPHCKERVAKKSLDLINRQKAEIERLKKTIKSHEKIRRAYQRYLIGNGVEYLWDATIKEFAERAKGKAHFSEDFGEAAVSCHDIDALVKEMTEEKK